MDYNKTANFTGRFNSLWFVGESFNTLCWASVTWLAVGLITYGIRTGKWKRENVRSVSHVNAGSVYTAAVLAVTLSYIRLLGDQLLFNVGFPGSPPGICEIAADMSVTGYGLTVTMAYIFLWFRQHSLYRHPTMTCISRPWIPYVNYGTLVFIVVGSLTSLLAYTIPTSYTGSEIGCITLKNSNKEWGIYLANSTIVVGQVLLLALFVYPLRSNLQGSNAGRIRGLLWRTTATAIMCVISDLFCMVLFLFVVPQTGTRQVPSLLYEANMMVNLASVLLSFESWRKILTGFACKQRVEAPVEPRVSSATREESTQLVL